MHTLKAVSEALGKSSLESREGTAVLGSLALFLSFLAPPIHSPASSSLCLEHMELAPPQGVSPGRPAGEGGTRRGGAASSVGKHLVTRAHTLSPQERPQGPCTTALWGHRA